jgi:hypothetical protein
VLKGEETMNQANLNGRKKYPRRRRTRVFGMTDSILSNLTVYLNPYVETGSNLSVEEAALYAFGNRFFNK